MAEIHDRLNLEPIGNTNAFEVDPVFPQFHFDNLGTDDEGRAIRFPDLLDYGISHAMDTAKLAIVILSHDFKEADTEQNQRVLWTAALFHDLGRSEPVKSDDGHHAKRSAELASRILGKYGLGAMREEVTRLIFRHHELAESPLERCLHDADAFEASRYLPGTQEGMEYLGRRCQDLVTPFGRRKENLRRYMGHKGW